VYRFLFSVRWIGAFVLCVLAALICVRLAHWQLDRLHQKRIVNASIATARTAEPRPIDTLMSVSTGLTPRQEYAQADVTGHYDPAAGYLVRNRPMNGAPGFLVLTPLRTAEGQTIWVARGWVPVSPRGVTAAPPVPAPPTGTVTITGRIRAIESGHSSRIKVEGTRQITRITRPVLDAAGDPAQTYRGYLELATQRPPTTGDELTTLPPPDDLDEGPHFAYAIQWYMFACGFLIGYVILARRRAREGTETGDPGPAGPDGPPGRPAVPPDTGPDDAGADPAAALAAPSTLRQ
jgi:cytochrome oxidase assembly protein ShyY1